MIVCQPARHAPIGGAVLVCLVGVFSLVAGATERRHEDFVAASATDAATRGRFSLPDRQIPAGQQGTEAEDAGIPYTDGTYLLHFSESLCLFASSARILFQDRALEQTAGSFSPPLANRTRLAVAARAESSFQTVRNLNPRAPPPCRAATCS